MISQQFECMYENVHVALKWFDVASRLSFGFVKMMSRISILGRHDEMKKKTQYSTSDIAFLIQVE